MSAVETFPLACPVDVGGKTIHEVRLRAVTIQDFLAVKRINASAEVLGSKMLLRQTGLDYTTVQSILRSNPGLSTKLFASLKSQVRVLCNG